MNKAILHLLSSSIIMVLPEMFYKRACKDRGLEIEKDFSCAKKSLYVAADDFFGGIFFSGRSLAGGGSLCSAGMYLVVAGVGGGCGKSAMES